MPDPFESSIQGYRRRMSSKVGGSDHAKGKAVVEGFSPTLDAIKIEEYVVIDSRVPSTKLFPTQSFPLSIEETKDIDAGTNFQQQVIGRFERRVNAPVFLSVPLVGISGRNFVNAPSVGQANFETNPVLSIFLLKVDLSSGPFKLEDMTWDNSHALTSFDPTNGALYDTPANFFNVKFNILLFGNVEVQIPVGDSINSVDISADQSSQRKVISTYLRDDRLTDAGPFTGIHMFFAPVGAGGGGPPPSGAGDFANVRAFVSDPIGPSTGFGEGRSPFALDSGFDLVDNPPP